MSMHCSVPCRHATSFSAGGKVSNRCWRAVDEPVAFQEQKIPLTSSGTSISAADLLECF